MVAVANLAGVLRRGKKKPVLAVDVDGVISLFGFEDISNPPGDVKLIEGLAHCIAHGVGERLGRLEKHYELVWASGWEDRANDHLPILLGLSGELPVLSFDGAAQFGSAHWKLGPIEDYGQGRPLAWIDDSIDSECERWAVERPEPTLLVPVESHIGLTDGHTEALISWARSGYTPR